jgi:S-DNA-T family DNA segregation ATPase FtsK/SpoIIIE
MPIQAVALTLLLIGLALTGIVLGRSSPDPYGLPVYFDGILGETGDVLRDRLAIALGVAVYFFTATWLILAAVLLVRPNLAAWAQRALGYLILIPFVALAADRSTRDVGIGPLYGSGGTIGAALAIWLDARVSQTLSAALLLFGLGGGLWLLADVVLIQLALVARATLRRLARWTGRTILGIAIGLETVATWLRILVNHLERAPNPAPAVVRAAESLPPPLPRPTFHAVSIPDAESMDNSQPVANPLALLPAPNINRGGVEGSQPVFRGSDLPPIELLDDSPPPAPHEDDKLREVAAQIEKALGDFGISVKVVGIHPGPVITQYEIALEIGLRVAKVTALSDDLALQLKVPSVRVVAPLPGKNTVGIEVPNDHRDVVRLKELILAAGGRSGKAKLPLFLGKDTEGRPLVHDLADMPHLLIAGRTGTGKSVCLNSIILSLLLVRKPEECKLVMLDPKRVELIEYGRLPHLLNPVVTENKKAEAVLSWAVDKMEERYEILKRARVRNISAYNELGHDEILKRAKPIDEIEYQKYPPRMPYIVIVVDEVGDLMMAMKKEVEGHIIRLAQMSRAAGIHLILTTQRPTVDVITGLIKSNLPARICFQVADRSNSRVVLDEMGAEKLLGKGDMLFLQPNTSSIVRAQGAYASDSEIMKIVSFLEVENPAFDAELSKRLEEKEEEPPPPPPKQIRPRDEMYEQAVEIIIREARGSVSLLQRALGIGYGRAARLIDYMAEDGIVGHYNGAQAREVLFTPEKWAQIKNGGSEPLADSA